MHQRTTRVMVLLTLLVGSFLLAHHPVQAATIVVTTTTDEVNTDGDCSLREAIRAANLDLAIDACPQGAGTDTITLLASSYTLTLTGAGEDAGMTGDLDITRNVIIHGAGVSTTIIDGNHLDRVFHMFSTATVSIANMTIRNGTVPGGMHVAAGGGISNAGALVLRNTVVSQNRAGGTDETPAIGGGVGGGMYNAGDLSVIDSTITTNQAASDYVEETGDYYPGFGGGIANSGTLRLTGSDVASNHASISGGIHQDGGTLALTRSRVLSNGASGYCRDCAGSGGGLTIARGSATVVESTIAHNRANGTCYVSGDGGGMVNAAILTITQSTVSRNSVSGDCWGGGSGGGISNSGTLTVLNSTISSNVTESGGYGSSGAGLSNSGTVRLRSSTISANEAQTGDTTSYGIGPGVSNASEGSLYVQNTMIAGNLSGDPRRPECAGTIISEGYNLIRNTADCTITGNHEGNIVNVASGLAALGDNGGPTQTHLLHAGSPAINAGSPTTCPDVDQRSIPRPQGARCDIGAVEVQQPGGPTPTRTATTTATVTTTATTPPTTPTATPSMPPKPTLPHHRYIPMVTTE